ncbi:MAG: TatD family nuclease-associated radical SAM protein [Elusimicrobiaceae bacterium]|nr:TatD family nuclease-associated radical SAM protein [Elusimicrobiaceae bacterium]
MAERTIVYRFKEGLYINLTNRCPNLCVFCIKTKWHMQFDGHNLDLAGQEPTAQEVLIALEKEITKAPVKEVVFCGYGECTMRLDTLVEIGRSLKQAQQQGKYPAFPIRLNTNGLGNLINKRNIVPELKQAVDIICVSLNAENETLWRQLVRPAPGYENGFPAVLDFIHLCSQAGFTRVTASCVENTGANPQAVQALACQYGAQFNEREFLDEQ